MAAEYQTTIHWNDESFAMGAAVPSNGFLGFITSISEGQVYSLVEVQMIPGNLIFVALDTQPLKRHKFKWFKKKDQKPEWYQKPFPFCNMSEAPGPSKDQFQWRLMGVKREGLYCDLLVPVSFFSRKDFPKPPPGYTPYQYYDTEIGCDFCFENNVAFSPVVGRVVFFGNTIKFNRHTFYYVWVSRPRYELLDITKNFQSDWIVKKYELKHKRPATSLDIKLWHLSTVRVHKWGVIISLNEENYMVEIFTSEHEPIILGYAKQCFTPNKVIVPGSWVRFATCKHVRNHQFALNLIRRNLPNSIKTSTFVQSMGLIKLELREFWVINDEDLTLGFEIGSAEHRVYNPMRIKCQKLNTPVVTYDRAQHKLHLRSYN